MLAEAAQRWGVGGDAATHYTNGVEAAITQLSAYGSAATISATVAKSYIMAHPYNPTIGISQINYQYWLATLMDEYECWSNWRRTSTTANTNPKTGASGYPQLIPTHYPGNNTNGTIPRRLTYPPSQKVTNLANYNAAVALLNTGGNQGDKMVSRVWWDVAVPVGN